MTSPLLLLLRLRSIITHIVEFHQWIAVYKLCRGSRLVKLFAHMYVLLSKSLRNLWNGKYSVLVLAHTIYTYLSL